MQLTPQLLLAAYAQGAFPMARSRRSAVVEWFSPDPRAVLPLESFRCPRSLRAVMRRGVFEIRTDTVFEKVIRACAESRKGERETWINGEIIRAYTRLHESGFAHSVEAFSEDRLVGGLYGVSLGGAFFGESMFHHADRGGTDASKVCLVHLVQRLRERGYTLLDTQINSPHMQQFGTVDIPRAQYLIQLEKALRQKADWA